MNGIERKNQIVDITLALLKKERVEQVTTRLIAKKVGVSQPALFRHFPNREAIFIAVIDCARDHFANLAKDILKTDNKAMEALSEFCFALLSYVEKNPGISRILFYDVANGKEEKLRRHLRRFLAMQTALVKTLITEAVELKELPKLLDIELATNQWLALVSGTVLQWQISGRRTSLASQTKPLLNSWQYGVSESCLVEKIIPVSIQHCLLGGLDVNPILQRGEDPLDDILNAMKRIDPSGMLVLRVPFCPKPLLALMNRSGHKTKYEEHGPYGWEVWIYGLEAEPVKDLRDLPIPEPMEHILYWISTVKEKRRLLVRTPRIPLLLLERLESMGHPAVAIESLDGSGLVGIQASQT